MKITLTHKQQREVRPDDATIRIKIETRGIDHATSASRANFLQNQILQRLSPLGINQHLLQLAKTHNEFDHYGNQPLKATTRRDLKIRIKHPEPGTLRLIMDQLSLEVDEVTASLAWKMIETATIRKQLLLDAITALQKLAESAAPSGKATAQEISVDGATPHIHRHRTEDDSFYSDCRGVKLESPLEHQSTTLSPSPILFGIELTGTFLLE